MNTDAHRWLAPTSVLQGCKNLKYFPDNETRIVISHCRSNGSCKNKNRKFTMKCMKGHQGLAPGARDKIYPQVRIKPRHAAHASQFLTM
jgi:hypothetical protein